MRAKLGFGLATIACAMIGTSVASADQLALYQFTGAAGNEATLAATSSHASITAGNISRGAGVNAAAFANAFGADAYTLADTLTTTDNEYVAFTLTTTQAGVTIESISFDILRTLNPARSFQLRSSLTSTTSLWQDVNGSRASGATVSSGTITLSPTHAAFTNMASSTAVEFRIYGWDAATAGNDLAFDNIVINGTTGVPEPVAAGLLGLGALLLRRRR